MRTQRGFTLTDLMISLAVFAIVTGFAVPSMSEFIQESRMAAATNKLVATLNFARNQAVNKIGRVMVCPSTDGATCTGGNRWDQGWIVFTDNDETGQPTSPGDLLRVGGPLDNIHADSGGRTRTRFKTDGMAHGFNLTIKLCHPRNPERHRAVIVSNPGRIRSGPLPDHLSCPPST